MVWAQPRPEMLLSVLTGEDESLSTAALARGAPILSWKRWIRRSVS
jgi:hypothetical protein